MLNPRTLIVAIALALTAAAPVWQEDATRLYYDGKLHLAWANSLGDWVDAAGTPQGTKPFARLQITRSATPVVAKFDVTQLVSEHGADFRVMSEGGVTYFASREAAEGKPELRVTAGGQTRMLAPAADVSMASSTVKSLGLDPKLSTRGAFLIRFDQPASPAITRAELVLTATKSFGAPLVTIYRPAPTMLDPAAPAPATAAAAPAAPRARPRPTADADALTPTARRALSQTGRTIRPATPPRAGAARILASWSGADIKPRGGHERRGDVLTTWIEGSAQTATADVLTVPGRPTEAYLTVLIKLHDDWTAKGGKLPGLTNTGMETALADPCIIDNVPRGRGGWGGRGANGCRWSARTGYWGVRDGKVGAGTYFYALKPHSVNGVVDYWSVPMPKGRWFAYVERVRLNDPGRANGEIGYWLVDDGAARGGRAVQAMGGIIWRDTDQPASAINEVWANIFCGGRDCGPAPWPRSTVSLRRLTVTDTLPDLAAIQREVDAMNRGA